MRNPTIKELKDNLAYRAKHGVDFIISATIIWSFISFVWTLPFSAYNLSILTFITGSLMLPLAYILSKFLDTEWKMSDNQLQPLGLWLNLAQLFYFPFLIFVLLKNPAYFIMTYAIITGAHLFPFAWLYDEAGYAIMGGVIPISSLLLGLNLTEDKMYLIPVSITTAFALFAVWILIRIARKKNNRDWAPYFTDEKPTIPD